jgi:hypothetical protein
MFIDTSVRPGDSLTAFALDDNYSFGILSSEISLALHNATLDDVPDLPARPLPELVQAAARANMHRDNARYAIAGQGLGALIIRAARLVPSPVPAMTVRPRWWRRVKWPICWPGEPGGR